MKILLIGRQFPDSFAKNIAVGFQDMGHQVETYEENRLFPRISPSKSLKSGKCLRYLEDLLIKGSTFAERMSYKSLLRKVESMQAELIVVTYNLVPPAVIDRMRSLTDAKIVLWFPDYLGNFGRQYILESNFDALFFKDPYIVGTLSTKLNMPAYYLPECCNPQWHKRVTLSKDDLARYQCDLTTACNMYPYRAKLLDQFVGYDFKIWGDYFPKWFNSPLRKHFQGKFVAEHTKAKAFNAAKIVINTMHYGEIEGVNCRLFEAAGCGAFQIADWKPALKELFEPEKEIVTFQTAKELKEKVDYYLAHDQERIEIAERAYRRAHNEHTYEQRLAKLLGIVFDRTSMGTTERTER